MVIPSGQYLPGAERGALYERVYRIFMDTYWTLQAQFQALAELRSEWDSRGCE